VDADRSTLLVKQSLVERLRSPIDGSPLALESEAQADGEVVTGVLRDASGNQFPIVDGVPRFAPVNADDETFNFKWRMIGDSYGHEAQSRDTRQRWYLERFGFGTREALLAFLQHKDLILDAGTGSGVDTAMFAESGRTVIAIDLSYQAVLAAYRQLGHLPNVHVLQADLQHLPFPPATFDYISSDQVLHHTPDTAQSFAALARHLRAGGEIAAYVYSRKAPIREFTDDFVREVATRMTAEECYELSRSITLLGKALSDLKAEVEVPEDIPLLGITAGRHDVQRLIYWTMMKCFWNDDYDLVTNTLINFDWYHPHYAWRHTPEEVRGWFAQHGLDLVAFDIAPSGISARGRLR
jgi:SAM-dependent methyltransferase